MAESTRVEALSILDESEGKALLAELYGRVIENVTKRLISGPMKNQELSGDPASGSVEAKRFSNAKSQDYGTARTAGKGNAIHAKPVTVLVNQDKEIVEEVALKDTMLYGVDGLLNRRASNHVLRMLSELDTEFFKAAGDAATEVESCDGTDIEASLEALIQECEMTKNDYVDGVDRGNMHLVLSPAWYGKIRTQLDRLTRVNVDTTVAEFNAWHGVETQSCVHLPEGVDALLMVDGAVAQPVMANSYQAEKIPLSEDYGISLFYHYGTAVVTPDLIFKNKAGDP